jgi:hypothetical protein
MPSAVSRRRNHDCPGGCARRVTAKFFACHDCWHRLPGPLKRDVLRGYRLRGSGDSSVHVEAMLAAVNWYRAHPLTAPAGP